MSEKHEAAKRLLQAAEQMRDLLTPETDGTHLYNMIRTVVCNARCIHLLTRPDLRDPEDDDEDETDEGMFDPEE